MPARTRVALLVVLTLTLAVSAGCGDVSAKVEAAENPAPAGTYEAVDVASRVSLNEKANYRWSIGGVEHDAVTNASTEYWVDGQQVDLDSYEDADGNSDEYEGYNTDSFDDTYDIIVEPDGVITAINLNSGE